MKKWIKQLLYPIRKAMGRFIIAPPRIQGYINNNTIISKAATIVQTDKIKGDYLEFGVWTGKSFVEAYKTIEKISNHWITEPHWFEKLWTKKRFFAFDSFEGLPKPSGVDCLSQAFRQGLFCAKENDFKKFIVSKGVPLDRVTIVPGWFENTLNEGTRMKYDMKYASIVHIDCDLYESAALALNFVTPLLVDGSIIIFDDWYNFRGNPNLGEQRACREWIKSNPDWILTQFQKEGPWRNSFIANKRDI